MKKDLKLFLWFLLTPLYILLIPIGILLFRIYDIAVLLEFERFSEKIEFLALLPFELLEKLRK